VVDGLSDDKFETLDPSIPNAHLVSFLDPVPRVARVSHVIGGKKIGVLHVEKHERAPIIVLKGMGNDLREGTVYFRYVGETRQIKPGELRAIIEAREARAVAEFSRIMNRVAPARARLLTSILAKYPEERAVLSSTENYFPQFNSCAREIFAGQRCADAPPGRRRAADIGC
jgi:hypothetical protein